MYIGDAGLKKVRTESFIFRRAAATNFRQNRLWLLTLPILLLNDHKIGDFYFQLCILMKMFAAKGTSSDKKKN